MDTNQYQSGLEVQVEKLKFGEMTPEILCTLGPASMDQRTIQRLEQSGATLFRINLSHTKVADLPRIVNTIREATQVPICLDTEGAQIRTGEFVEGSITLRENTTVRVHYRRVPADDKNFNFYPLEIARSLKPGDFVSIDFNSVLVQVIKVDNEGVSMRVLQGGLVGQNKAVTVEREIPMPPLTEKDQAALKLGCEMGLKYFALSFASRGEDVQFIRNFVGESAFIISKIESRSGLENLEEIASRSDALLIDRGDLSRQVPIELLPQTQKSIIYRAKAVGCRVYVATNLLESMVSTPAPTRAEVNDIYNTLADGTDGLVLAAETAIGKFPIQCVSMVSKIIHGFKHNGFNGGSYYPIDAISQLIEPHGGRLVHREATPGELADLDRIPQITVPEKELMDCEQFGYGTYSPLKGFMTRDTLESVLGSYRLPSGEVWTLPILLQINSEQLGKFAEGDRVALTDEAGIVHALLDVSEIYQYNFEKLAARMFGTNDRNHPGVANLMKRENNFLGGEVTLVQPLKSDIRHYLLSPAQTRFIFTRLGWSQVVGFHSRNPAHRGHEYIQLQALERSGADGIYINPVIGPKKRGDFLAEPIMLSYQTMLEFGRYPRGKVVLGSFFTYSRYAGPREAVFTALCRKNMGCSHFIIGRDHTGVGNFYSHDANRKLFDSLGDIGIKPIFFETVGYNSETGTYEVEHGQKLKMISGTQVRETLGAGQQLPDWFMRNLVQEVLLDELRNGSALFYQ
ncbi:MAG: pyruvate kinase [Anaerolineales bacterium]|jgi:ATP sulfurylase